MFLSCFLTSVWITQQNMKSILILIFKIYLYLHINLIISTLEFVLLIVQYKTRNTKQAEPLGWTQTQTNKT